MTSVNTAPENVACWFEIPVTDLARSKTFYETLLKSKMTEMEMGPNKTVMFTSDEDPGVSGHLYEGKPAPTNTGNTIHLVVPDAKLETALERVEPAGGKVVSPIISIPAGRFAYCTDPDGNSIGLFGA